jgi:hypothetical protein
LTGEKFANAAGGRGEGSMADRNRRFIGAAIALPFFFLVISGLAQANEIIVTTTSGGSVSGQCSLVDAIAAANMGMPVHGCAPGSGDDVIFFNVTGTIVVDASDLPLTISDPELAIIGPNLGCSGPGPCGVTINGNEAVAPLTGGLVLAGPGTSLLLEGLTFTEGIAAEGGAIYVDGTNLFIDDCLFVDNDADDQFTLHGGMGGAIFINSTGTVDILNSTFADNVAMAGVDVPTGSVGGAIADMNTSVPMKITNSTFDGNESGNGGGYFALLEPFVKGTIFDDNTPDNCGVADIHDEGFNIDSGDSCLVDTGLGSLANTDPKLLPLANNGGPTNTFALESTSPARSLDTDCTDQETTPEPLTFDQRFYTRPNSPSFCDTGAYEFDGKQPIALVPGSERLQLVHAGDMSDQINTNFTFIDNGPGFDTAACDTGNDAFNFLEVGIIEGTCADLPDSGLFAKMTFITHVVNHETYGTDFNTDPLGILSARMVALPTPAGSCGEWTLNLELSGLNLSEFGLTGTNPFALYILDGDDNAGCFDIDNAIVGGKIDPPARSVRRGVRR